MKVLDAILTPFLRGLSKLDLEWVPEGGYRRLFFSIVETIKFCLFHVLSIKTNYRDRAMLDPTTLMT